MTAYNTAYQRRPPYPYSCNPNRRSYLMYNPNEVPVRDDSDFPQQVSPPQRMEEYRGKPMVYASRMDKQDAGAIGPPPMGRYDLWELQFNRWWGWNWVRKQKHDDRSLHDREEYAGQGCCTPMKDFCRRLWGYPTNYPPYDEQKAIFDTPSNSELGYPQARPSYPENKQYLVYNQTAHQTYPVQQQYPPNQQYPQQYPAPATNQQCQSGPPCITQCGKGDPRENMCADDTCPVKKSRRTLQKEQSTQARSFIKDRTSDSSSEECPHCKRAGKAPGNMQQRMHYLSSRLDNLQACGSIQSSSMSGCGPPQFGCFSPQACSCGSPTECCPCLNMTYFNSWPCQQRPKSRKPPKKKKKCCDCQAQVATSRQDRGTSATKIDTSSVAVDCDISVPEKKKKSKACKPQPLCIMTCPFGCCRCIRPCPTPPPCCPCQQKDEGKDEDDEDKDESKDTSTSEKTESDVSDEDPKKRKPKKDESSKHKRSSGCGSDRKRCGRCNKPDSKSKRCPSYSEEGGCCVKKNKKQCTVSTSDTFAAEWIRNQVNLDMLKNICTSSRKFPKFGPIDPSKYDNSSINTYNAIHDSQRRKVFDNFRSPLTGNKYNLDLFEVKEKPRKSYLDWVLMDTDESIKDLKVAATKVKGDREHTELLTAVCDAILSNKSKEKLIDKSNSSSFLDEYTFGNNNSSSLENDFFHSSDLLNLHNDNSSRVLRNRVRINANNSVPQFALNNPNNHNIFSFNASGNPYNDPTGNSFDINNNQKNQNNFAFDGQSKRRNDQTEQTAQTNITDTLVDNSTNPDEAKALFVSKSNSHCSPDFFASCVSNLDDLLKATDAMGLNTENTFQVHNVEAVYTKLNHGKDNTPVFPSTALPLSAVEDNRPIFPKIFRSNSNLDTSGNSLESRQKYPTQAATPAAKSVWKDLKEAENKKVVKIKEELGKSEAKPNATTEMNSGFAPEECNKKPVAEALQLNVKQGVSTHCCYAEQQDHSELPIRCPRNVRFDSSNKPPGDQTVIPNHRIKYSPGKRGASMKPHQEIKKPKRMSDLKRKPCALEAAINSSKREPLEMKSSSNITKAKLKSRIPIKCANVKLKISKMNETLKFVEKDQNNNGSQKNSDTATVDRNTVKIAKINNVFDEDSVSSCLNSPNSTNTSAKGYNFSSTNSSSSEYDGAAEQSKQRRNFKATMTSPPSTKDSTSITYKEDGTSTYIDTSANTMLQWCGKTIDMNQQTSLDRHSNSAKLAARETSQSITEAETELSDIRYDEEAENCSDRVSTDPFLEEEETASEVDNQKSVLSMIKEESETDLEVSVSSSNCSKYLDVNTSPFSFETGHSLYVDSCSSPFEMSYSRKKDKNLFSTLLCFTSGEKNSSPYCASESEISHTNYDKTDFEKTRSRDRKYFF